MTQQPIPVSTSQPLLWQGLIAAAIDIVILIALASWAISQAKKAWRGEEVERPI